ncbi:hypothetical protein GCM10027275_25680 [Rhabdobacter roseus]|uniref:TVP38/TMEM64 family membrane protein n=1 Tax=Rhabdobacter roseus TaxID=1655419 RepID=A0A840TM86_9BACT|nr:VTT domain-containing protein [Rhabdobacter roseus]MBB5284514.1 putative membrane protein YdjX (TVP38/TMEM64 family) [Rhabdobacter roseus]
MKGRFLRYLPVILSVTIVGGIALAYGLWPAFRTFGQEAWEILTSNEEARIADWIGGFGFWAPLLLLALFLVQMLAFVIPSWLLILVCILAYGPWWGSGLALLGILFASTVAYVLGHSLSKDVLVRMLGKSKEKKMEQYLDHYGLGLVVVVRLAPFLSNDTVSFVAGLVAMSYVRFLLATAVGITPLIALLAYLGENTDQLKRGLLWASVVCLVGFVGYIWWDRRQGAKSEG